MKDNKITAVYARTSSKKQDYKLQLEAAKPYLKGIEPEDVINFIDHGVSGLSQPKELEKLIDLISKNQISTLIVYDRNRLNYSVDSYLQLVNLINIHQIDVIFTSGREEIHNLEDISREGIWALIRKMERIMLSNRIKLGIKGKRSKYQR
ncbi:MAG: recombinase family protein [Bacillota bacterium]|nr:recombinase family protein [Bacillota bacterium]